MSDYPTGHDIAYNLAPGGYEAEQMVGIQTLTSWNGFNVGEIAILKGTGGTKGTIRRFIVYPGSKHVNVDFLPEGYMYTGIEANAEDLQKLSEDA